MLTQKEALKNLCSGLPVDYRLLLVSNWLEDINWHKENNILMTDHKFRMPGKMDALETYTFLTQKYNYSIPFVDELEAKLKANGKYDQYELLAGNLKNNQGGFIDHEFIDSSDTRNYARTMWYQQFSYMFGWGIDGADWKSKGHGQEFADELWNDIINLSE